MKLETLLANIPKYSEIEDIYGASHLPIYNTATFDVKRQTEGKRKYDYSRSDNPTRNALETIFAKAENGTGCVSTSTGIGAIALLFDAVLQQNDTVLVEKDCYGGTYRLLKVLLEKNNIKTLFADFTNLEEVNQILSENKIRLVLCESPTNPGIKVIDLEAVAAICKKHTVLMAVDNSMATFASLHPLDLGADFSVFSTTKFISGHGSVTAGALVSKTKEWDKKIWYMANAQGRTQPPFDAYITSLGLPTLVYRMKAQEQSALKLAQFLETHPDILEVKFPGLPSHSQYELAKKQFKIIPSVLTINVSTKEKAIQLIKNTKLFGEKVSFGAADSRMELPAKMSHATYSEADLKAIGLTFSTIRISVGLEDTDDLIEDIIQALK
jgi:cysteine-S-conjugate beta-lyase